MIRLPKIEHVKNSIQGGYEMVHKNATDALSNTIGQGYGATREYADKAADLAANASSNLRDFTRREPWLALLAAFTMGWTMAPVMNRLLGRSSE